MNGEKFLDRIYNDLHLEPAILHASKVSDNKYEKIANWLNRADEIFKKANKHNKKIFMKNMLYKRCIIKEENIPKRAADKEKIIEAQKETLDKWIDYLSDENSMYPAWVKYWIFRGMLKIGTYDEANDKYGRRSPKTTAPFIEANPEVIAKCINYMCDYVEKGELQENDLKVLIENGQFSKLYTTLLKTSKKELFTSTDYNDGIWIKYNQGEKEEAKKLYDSLQEKNTGWCTAGSLTHATEQVCGGGGYREGGDFYVYYTKGTSNEYDMPRIAIRMSGHDEIAEIRGIDENQNLEDNLESVLEAKLKEMDFISENGRNKYLKKCRNMKKISEINKKKDIESITLEDLYFIYEVDEDLSFFGFGRDRRVEKIKDRVKFGIHSNDKKLVINVVNTSAKCLQYASEDLKEDEDVVLTAIKRSYKAYIYISEKLKQDRNFILKAVRINAHITEYLSETFKDDEEIITLAITNTSDMMQYASDRLKQDREFVEKIIEIDGYCINYVDEKLKQDRELVLKAVRNNGIALSVVDPQFCNDKEVVLEAVKNTITALCFISPELKKDKEFFVQLLKWNPEVIDFVPSELKSDTDIIILSEGRDKYKLAKVTEEEAKDKNYVLEAIKENAKNMLFVDNELLSDLDYVFTMINENIEVLYYIPDRIWSNKEFMVNLARNYHLFLGFYQDNNISIDELPHFARTLSDNIFKDPDFILEVSKKSIVHLHLLPQSLRENKEFLLKFILAKPTNLDYNPELLKDRELILNAVKLNPKIMEYAYSYEKDPEFIAAVESNSEGNDANKR